MPNHFHGSEEMNRRYTRQDHYPRGRGAHREGPIRNEGSFYPHRRASRSRSPILQRDVRVIRSFHEQRFEKEHEHPLRRSREDERRNPQKPRIVPATVPRILRMDETQKSRPRPHNRIESRDRERVTERPAPPKRPERHDDRNSSNFGKRYSNSVFADLDRVVKKAREEKGSSYWSKKVIEAEEKDPNRWGHSGFKELYRHDVHQGSNQNARNEFSRRSRSPSPPRRKRVGEEGSLRPNKRSRSPKNFSHRRRSRSPGAGGQLRETGQLLKSISGPKRVSPTRRTHNKVAAKSGSGDSKTNRNIKDKEFVRRDHHDERKMDHRDEKKMDHSDERKMESLARSRQSDISTRKRSPDKSVGKSGGVKARPKSAPLLSRPNSGREQGNTNSKGNTRQKQRSRNSSISEDEDDDSSRTPSPQLKNRSSRDVKEHQSRAAKSTSKSSSYENTTSDEDVLEIHAQDRPQSASRSANSSSEESISDESVRKTKTRTKNSSVTSSESDSSEDDSDLHGKGREQAKKNQPVPKKPVAATKSKQSTAGQTHRISEKEKDKSAHGKLNDKQSGLADPKLIKDAPKTAIQPAKEKLTSPGSPSGPKPKEKASLVDSESETDSSSESEEEPRLTLSERFAKLTQMSTDKREFAKPEISITDIDTKLKVVKDLRNANTRVFVNQHQPPPARTRPKTPDIVEGEMRYSSDDRRRHFERMTRDEPRDRDRPDDWSEVRVRYNYYKTRGYFDERPLSLEEYIKWETWWYSYRNWLAEEGYYDQQQSQSGPGPDRERRNSWRPPPHHHEDRPSGGQRPFRLGNNFHPPQESFHGRPHYERFHQDIPHYDEGMERQRVPIFKRIGHANDGLLTVNIRHQGGGQGNFRGGGRGRLAGRIGFRR